MCTPAPIVELEDTCAYNYIECGDVTLGKNVGFPDWAGYPSGGALVSRDLRHHSAALQRQSVA